MAVLSCEFLERDGYNEGTKVGDTDCYCRLKSKGSKDYILTN
jgi:hypothetical protein